MNTNIANQTKTQTREISKETSKLVESLDYLLKAESSAIQYFWETYGDQTDLWDKSVLKEDLQEVKTSLKILLGDSVELNLGDLKSNLI